MFWILFLLLLKENLLCCLAALSFKNELAELERKCYSNVKNTNAKAVGLNKCPHVFSGACWPETLANTTVSLDCPEIFFFPSGKILRRCNESGNWEAVNVTQCRRRTGHPSPDKPPGNDLRVYAALCWVSFLIMVPSLILTLHLFECKNERFNVHTNLILAFIFETVAFFIHYYGNLKHPRNSRMCNAFWIMHRYFSAAEIMWMFNEALLLLRKVVIIFDKKSYMKYYLIIGWGAPFLLIMAAYVPVMVTVVDLAPKKCWYYYRTSTYNLVLYAPLVLVLILLLSSGYKPSGLAHWQRKRI